MSQHYILRREGKEYKAPSLESLRQWAQDGRIMANDMVFSPRFQNWYRAKDLRELRDVLGSGEEKASGDKFWLRKDEKNYVADSMETILEWASKGNVGPDDLVYHPTYARWFRAGDSPQIASRFPSNHAGPLPSAVTTDAGHYQPSTSTSPLGSEQRAELDALAAVRTVADFDSDAVREALSAEDEAEKVSVDEAETPGGQTEESLDAAPNDAAPNDAAPNDAAPNDAESAPMKKDADTVADLQAVVSPPAEAADLSALKVDVDYDENARFKDDGKVMKLFYDVARVFIVTKDVRPGESVEAECRLPSTGDDFKGIEKKEIYARLRGRMNDHLLGPVRAAREEVEEANLPGYARFVDRALDLVGTLDGADEVIGIVPPGRVVIGNAGRPKMTPAEEEIMLDFDRALKGVISCRAK